jgi:hypothetical protein
VEDEQMKKLIQELSSMGFNSEDAKAAYAKAKKKDLDTLLDILSEEQEKKKA